MSVSRYERQHLEDFLGIKLSDQQWLDVLLGDEDVAKACVVRMLRVDSKAIKNFRESSNSLRQKIRERIKELRQHIEYINAMGLGQPDRSEAENQGCTWVPAALHQTGSRLVYGGVVLHSETHELPAASPQAQALLQRVAVDAGIVPVQGTAFATVEQQVKRQTSTAQLTTNTAQQYRFFQAESAIKRSGQPVNHANMRAANCDEGFWNRRGRQHRAAASQAGAADGRGRSAQRTAAGGAGGGGSRSPSPPNKRNYLSPADLEITHERTMGKKAFSKLVQNIKEQGINETIKYVVHDGKKYVVDGNHRLAASRIIGLNFIPVEEVELPYMGYQTIDDLHFFGFYL